MGGPTSARVVPPPQKFTKDKPPKKEKKKQLPRRTTHAKLEPPSTTPDLSTTIPLTLQQLLLNVFKAALLQTYGHDWSNNSSSKDALESPTNHRLDTKTLIQTIKSHLYNRDFDKAFTDANGELLRAYALRWSSTRALGYAGVLKALLRVLLRGPARANETNHVVCIGGGAGAEIVALAAVWRDLMDAREQKALLDGVAAVKLGGGDGDGKEPAPAPAPESESQPSKDDTQITAPEASSKSPAHSNLAVTAVDIADWSVVVDRLSSAIQSATVPAPEAHPAPLLKGSDIFSVRNKRADVLSLPDEQLRDLLHLNTPGSATVMVTLMFTLNELFSTSMAKTTGFLLRMTDLLLPGTMLLVVDSPGSYSTLKLGKSKAAAADGEGDSAAAPQERQYPMKFLLDHTLLSVAAGKWEQVVSQDSRWWRRDAARLKYEVGEGAGLEDMRYQVHVYRRLEE